jgi:protein SHQ1
VPIHQGKKSGAQCRLNGQTQDVEIHIDGAHFRLYVKPYFLKYEAFILILLYVDRIEFPGNLVEDGREHAAYDVASGLLRIRVPKATPGEQFENLNLLTQLGVNSRMQNLDAQPPAKGPLIEELDAGALDADSDDLVDEDFDWSFTPDLAPDDGIDGSLSSPKYGFNNQYSGVFVGFDAMETLRDIIDMGHPEAVLVRLDMV